MDFQQPPHRYARLPPPSSMADHHHRPPVPPPPNPWYSTQFQYQHHSSSPPRQHQQQQWAPQPPAHYPPPHPPYTAHHHSQYPPPLPPLPPPYRQVNQDWENSNWGHHQSWEYQAHSNGEDWAAKARSWAAATEHPHTQPQFNPAGRPGEQSNCYNQYALPIDSHFQDMQKPSFPASSYQHYSSPAVTQHQGPVSHQQELASFGLQQSSYGNLAGDSKSAYSQQENSSISPSVHQQEVPSSYSSVTGKEDAGQTSEYYMSSSLSVASAPQHHAQLPLPPGARSFSMEEPQYSFGGRPAVPETSLSDQPLDFAPQFNCDYKTRPDSLYSDSGGHVRGVATISSLPSNYAWDPPARTGAVYPPMSTVLPGASLVDPSMAVPPPVPGPSGTMFSRLPGPGFQKTVPVPAISASYNVGSGAALHSAAAFPGNAFGVSSVSERPKKASVPSWLREEIIKTKAVIPSSAPEFPIEDSVSVEDEGIHRSYEKGEQADSKCIISSRSTEEEEDDEDDVEEARTAAINQEIKRVLTEVLLKVTDELLDEIATKVLNEDNLSVQDDHGIGAPYNEVSTSTQAAPTAKAEATVLIPFKIKEAGSGDVNVKLPSTSAVDILGLASYASDNDDDDSEFQSSGKPNSRETSNHLESTASGISTGKNVVENGGLMEETKEHMDKRADLNIDAGRENPNVTTLGKYDRRTRELVKGKDTSLSKKTLVEKTSVETERPGESKVTALDNSEGREHGNKSCEIERRETKDSAWKDYVKEERSKDKMYEKRDGMHRWHDDHNGSKNKGLAKDGDKTKASDPRKRPSPDVKENLRENEREKKVRAKEDNGRKKGKKEDDEREKSRHKNASDSRRHKRSCRSPSVDSRGRGSKDDLVFNRINDSDDEPSDSSRRKRHLRRHESPSPVRSKRRQVSRSPHSRHSQGRPSSHTYLDTTRRKKSRSRSRSRSPAQRRR